MTIIIKRILRAMYRLAYYRFTDDAFPDKNKKKESDFSHYVQHKMPESDIKLIIKYMAHIPKYWLQELLEEGVKRWRYDNEENRPYISNFREKLLAHEKRSRGSKQKSFKIISDMNIINDKATRREKFEHAVKRLAYTDKLTGGLSMDAYVEDRMSKSDTILLAQNIQKIPRRLAEDLLQILDNVEKPHVYIQRMHSAFITADKNRRKELDRDNAKRMAKYKREENERYAKLYEENKNNPVDLLFESSSDDSDSSDFAARLRSRESAASLRSRRSSGSASRRGSAASSRHSSR